MPRTLEARGLDATPLIQHKLRSVGTPTRWRPWSYWTSSLREEVGHVAIGNHWYGWLCARQGLDQWRITPSWLRATRRRAQPPNERGARRAASFTEAELLWLQQAEQQPLQPKWAQLPTMGML